MGKSSSTDHHYIPQFYARGFARTDGTFDVYDKRYRLFKKVPQSAATVFFERNRNTIRVRGNGTDQIEKFYARFESEIAKVFALIRSGITAESLNSPNGIFLLKFHVAIQFWRLPKNDGLASNMMDAMRKETLIGVMQRLNITDFDPDSIEGLLKADSGFRHYFRSFWLPILTFDLSKAPQDGSRWRVLDVEYPSDWSNHLCCDAPLVFGSLQSLFNFDSPFAMPLSKTKLLVSSIERPARLELQPQFSTSLAMLLFLQAERYVAAPNREFLRKIIELCHCYYPGPEGERTLRRETLAYLE